MGKRRDRERPLRRPAASRDPRPRILVVCEGRLTEPQYFRSLAREEENRLVEVEIDDGGGSPKTLVERAVDRKKAAERESRRLRDENVKYDEVWCVFDVDEHPRLADARQQARDNGIHLAVSNPCFELWLLLHFQDQQAHVHRKDAASHLRRHLGGYEKHVPFAQVHPGYQGAVQRAQKLEVHHQEVGSPGGNPSTTVHHLTETIRRHGRDARLRR